MCARLDSMHWLQLRGCCAVQLSYGAILLKKKELKVPVFLVVVGVAGLKPKRPSRFKSGRE